MSVKDADIDGNCNVFEKEDNMKKNFRNLFIQYEKLLKISNEKEMFSLTTDEALQLQDILNLLEERGYIAFAKLTNCRVYKILGSLNDFAEWLEIQKNEQKRLNRREWTIAIVSAIIGGVLGLIPTIISLLSTYSK